MLQGHAFVEKPVEKVRACLDFDYKFFVMVSVLVDI